MCVCVWYLLTSPERAGSRHKMMRVFKFIFVTEHHQHNVCAVVHRRDAVV